MKQIFLATILLATLSLPAQPFLSISATTKGAGLSIGYLESQSGIEFVAGYNLPVFKAGVPRLLHLSIGKRILLTHLEKDNISVTPFIGYADCSVKDFSEYEKKEGNGAIIQVNKIRSIYGLELGKDMHLGRLYISVNYCDKPFLGIGLRAFIK